MPLHIALDVHYFYQHYANAIISYTSQNDKFLAVDQLVGVSLHSGHKYLPNALLNIDYELARLKLSNF